VTTSFHAHFDDKNCFKDDGNAMHKKGFELKGQKVKMKLFCTSLLGFPLVYE